MQDQSAQQGLLDPRNLWSHLLRATDALACGDVGAARDLIHGQQYHPEMSPDILTIWQAHLHEAIALRGVPPPLNHPADYTANVQGLFHPPFRQ